MKTWPAIFVCVNYLLVRVGTLVLTKQATSGKIADAGLILFSAWAIWCLL